MPCQVKNCVITDDRLSFHCYGACGKEFHATCAGTRRNHEDQIRSYMLPLCEDCQEEFTSIVKLRKLLQSQRTLTDDIEAANNKICAFINSFNVREAFDSLETNLSELRGELKTDCTVTQMINNVSSVVRESCNTDTFESSVQQANEALVSKIALKLEQAYLKLEGQLEAIHVSLSEIGTKEFPAAEILDEVKYLSHAVAAMQLPETAIIDNSHHLTLADELAQDQDNSRHLTLADELAQDLALSRSHHDDSLEDIDDSGWRLLGSKKVWKADWKAYDLRQLRRRTQEKSAQKARNRRKQNKNNYNINNRLNGINHNSRNNNTHNAINNNKIRNFNVTNNNNLPLDKDLLAAAKDRFSRPPPPPFRPTVRFQRGETLNPYPVDNDIPTTSHTPDSRNWMLRMAPGSAGFSSTRSCQSCSSQIFR